MDAFFAAIEQRDNPALQAKPVIIGADPKGGKGRGVVSTCSYEARRYGIHSAMPISIAYRRCPNAIFLPVNGEKYARVSGQIYKILYGFTPDVEPVSIDEAFLDITGSWRLFGPSPAGACMLIKTRIKNETGLTVSVGLAPTKMVAKIASDLKKPDGFVEVRKEGVLDFLWPLDISKLWGVGEKSEKILRRNGINTIGDIAKKTREELAGMFGVNGEHLWYLANGIDERRVEPETDAKSISNELTFERDTLNSEKIEGALMSLCEQVSARLRKDNFRGRTVTLKIRLEGFKTYTRAATFENATNFADTLYKYAKDLYNKFDTRGKKVRLVGVKVSGLSSVKSKDNLFGEAFDLKAENIHRALDKIKEKFGNQSIHRGNVR